MNYCVTEEACAACAANWPPEVVGLALAALNCQGPTCEEECRAPLCGLALSSTGVVIDPPCDECITESCCDESTACGIDPACAGLRVCTLLCEGDVGCAADCEDELPEGAALLETLQTCLDASCSDVCP